jgi:acetolactate synthase-1/2/3 large subunit
LRSLATRLRGKSVPHERADLSQTHQKLFSQAAEEALSHRRRERITKTYLSYAIGQVIDEDVIIFNEYNLDPMLVPRRHPDSWFENSIASGLGWSLGAALGAKMAAPEKTMVVTLGDGAYLFNTPLSAHYVATAEQLPILAIVFNDSAWTTTKKSTRGSHPGGWAVRTDRFPLCDFTSPIQFEKVAEACGGIGLRIERPAELVDRLREALSLVRTGFRHVLVNVLCERDG